jgi:hypothetical protein
MLVVKFALRSSLHLELACGELGVGSVKVVSGGASCGGHLFWVSSCSVRAGFLSLLEHKCVLLAQKN